MGRRWNIDPIIYPWQSSYATFNNNPIVFNDPWGLEGGDKKGDSFKGTDGKTYYTSVNSVEVIADKGTSIQQSGSGDIVENYSIPKPLGSNKVVAANNELRKAVSKYYDFKINELAKKNKYLRRIAGPVDTYGEPLNKLRKYASSGKLSDLPSPSSLASDALALRASATGSKVLWAYSALLKAMEEEVDIQKENFDNAILNSQPNILNSYNYTKFEKAVNKNNINKNYSDPHNIIIIYSSNGNYKQDDYFNFGLNEITPTNYARPLISLQNGGAYNGFKPKYAVWGYQGSYNGYSFKVQGVIEIK